MSNFREQDHPREDRPHDAKKPGEFAPKGSAPRAGKGKRADPVRATLTPEERHHYDMLTMGTPEERAAKAKHIAKVAIPSGGKKPAAPAAKSGYGTVGEGHPLAGMGRAEQVRRLEASRPGAGDEPGEHLGIDEAGPPPGLDMDRFGKAAAEYAHKHFHDHSYGAYMPDAYEALGKPFGLSKYDFLRAVTALHHRRDIRLSGWGKTPGEIPDPELVTQVSDKLMYFIQPGEGRITHALGWVGQIDRRGNTKAVGTGEHAGRVEYGEQAQRLLQGGGQQQGQGPPDQSGGGQPQQQQPGGTAPDQQPAAPAPPAKSPQEVVGKLQQHAPLAPEDVHTFAKASAGMDMGALQTAAAHLTDQLGGPGQFALAARSIRAYAQDQAGEREAAGPKTKGFMWSGVDKGGKAVRGRVSAASPEEAMGHVQSAGHTAHEMYESGVANPPNLAEKKEATPNVASATRNVATATPSRVATSAPPAAPVVGKTPAKIHGNAQASESVTQVVDEGGARPATPLYQSRTPAKVHDAHPPGTLDHARQQYADLKDELEGSHVAPEAAQRVLDAHLSHFPPAMQRAILEPGTHVRGPITVGPKGKPGEPPTLEPAHPPGTHVRGDITVPRKGKPAPEAPTELEPTDEPLTEPYKPRSKELHNRIMETFLAAQEGDPAAREHMTKDIHGELSGMHKHEAELAWWKAFGGRKGSPAFPTLKHDPTGPHPEAPAPVGRGQQPGTAQKPPAAPKTKPDKDLLYGGAVQENRPEHTPKHTSGSEAESTPEVVKKPAAGQQPGDAQVEQKPPAPKSEAELDAELEMPAAPPTTGAEIDSGKPQRAYHWRGQNAKGEPVEGRVIATDPAAAHVKAQASGHQIDSLTEYGKKKNLLPKKKAPPKKSVDSLLSHVIAAGGINPKALEEFGGVKEAAERGLSAKALKKGSGNGLDNLAEAFEAEGHFKTPPDRHPGDYLLEKLNEGARSLHASTDAEHDAAAEEYFRGLEEARQHHAADHIAAAIRAGEEEASRAFEEDPTGQGDLLAGGGAAGSDTAGDEPGAGGGVGDFPFGANEGEEEKPREVQPAESGVGFGKRGKPPVLGGTREEPAHEDAEEAPAAAAGGEQAAAGEADQAAEKPAPEAGPEAEPVAAPPKPSAPDHLARTRELLGKSYSDHSDEHAAAVESHVGELKKLKRPDVLAHAHEAGIEGVRPGDTKERALNRVRRAMTVAHRNRQPEPEPAPEAPPEPPPRTLPEAARPTAERFHKHLADSPGLSDDQRRHYGEAIDHVLAGIPAAWQPKLAEHVKKIRFAGSMADLRAAIGERLDEPDPRISPESQALIRRVNAKLRHKWQNAGGLYLPKTGELIVDGGGDGHFDGAHGGPVSGTTRHLYAHELGHALDGPDQHLSKDPGWHAAWEDEINKRGDTPVYMPVQNAPLTTYAMTDPQEGFAEFCRLVYSGHADLKAVAEEFPNAASFFKAKGLWPAHLEAGGEGETVPEVFDEKVPVPGGGHADTLLEKPKEPAPAEQEQPPAPPEAPAAQPAEAPKEEARPVAEKPPVDPAALGQQLAGAHSDRMSDNPQTGREGDERHLKLRQQIDALPEADRAKALEAAGEKVMAPEKPKATRPLNEIKFGRKPTPEEGRTLRNAGYHYHPGFKTFHGTDAAHERLTKAGGVPAGGYHARRDVPEDSPLHGPAREADRGAQQMAERMAAAKAQGAKAAEAITGKPAAQHQPAPAEEASPPLGRQRVFEVKFQNFSRTVQADSRNDAIGKVDQAWRRQLKQAGLAWTPLAGDPQINDITPAEPAAPKGEEKPAEPPTSTLNKKSLHTQLTEKAQAAGKTLTPDHFPDGRLGYRVDGELRTPGETDEYLSKPATTPSRTSKPWTSSPAAGWPSRPSTRPPSRTPRTTRRPPASRWPTGSAASTRRPSPRRSGPGRRSGPRCWPRTRSRGTSRRSRRPSTNWTG